MAQHFLDTSALVKHYHHEVGTPEVDRRWNDSDATLFISRLGVVEAVSVFAKKVRNGLISPADFVLLRQRLFADLYNRRPAIVRVLVRHYQEADQLLQRHGLKHGLHTLESLQLAVALDLRRRNLLDEFMTADQVLVNVAALEGLPVFDPEHP